jgi:hypothetical protein
MISYVGRSIANVCILVRASAADILKTKAQVYVVAHIKSALVSEVLVKCKQSYLSNKVDREW